jgi:CRP/FNR family cyclic AMP-dependent transcriptional regulator
VGVNKSNKLLATLTQGRSFGEMALIDHENRSAKVVSIGNSEFIAINQVNFDRLSQQHSALALQFVMKIACLLSQRLRQTTGQLADFM